MELVVFEVTFYSDVLQSVHLVGNLSLAFYVAVILDKYFGTLGYLLLSCVV